MWWFKLLMAMGLSVAVWAASESVQRAVDDFSYQLEHYRSVYDSFNVKRETFVRSGTFSAQEELVSAAKQMLDARAMTWWSYFQALRTMVAEQEGFDAEREATLYTQLNDLQNEIKVHQASVSAEVNKDALLSDAQAFNAKADVYKPMAYRTLTELELARMRAANTAISELEMKVKEAVAIQIRDTNSREVRLRGFDELTNLVKTIDEGITKAEQTSKLYQSSKSTKTGYDQVVKALDTPYQNLQRAQQLIHELSTGIEL